MKKISRWLWIFLFVFVAACMPSNQVPVKTSIPIPATATRRPATSTPTIEPEETGLTVEKLRNSVFFAPIYEKPVQLTEGEFRSTEGYADTVITLLSQIAIGDLNDDQVDDAAVLLAEDGGGTGVFVSLIVVVSNGDQYDQLKSFLIDDRPLIHSLAIENGQIELQATIHRINDSMAEPTLGLWQNYRVFENDLMLMAQKTTIPEAEERSITIDLPIDGSDVSNPVQVKGSMPIAPFENNLSLTIFDLAGNVLLQSGFMVTAEDLGGPATFDAPITIENIPTDGWVRIELAELSMADGSVLTSNSVVVKVQ